MRATPVVLVVAAFLVAACAPSSTQSEADLAPLADQADRVAQLIDEERPCEAVEAARTLASLADDEGLDEQVTRAVSTFATSATSSIQCSPSTPEPTTPPPPAVDDGDDRDSDEEDDDDRDKDDEDADDRDDDHPGEGKAKGKKNGKPGRGNDD